MKKAIHPTYFPEAEVVCACGNTFKVGSTTEKIDIELCSKCHPFYTGKQKLVDTARRVEKFHEKISRKDTGAVAAKKTKKAERVVTKKAKKDAK